MLPEKSVPEAQNVLAQEALRWIVHIFHVRNIPFQITGGLAAKVYGSMRPLNDIDIEIPDDRMEELVPDVAQYIEYGPSHFVDKRWDLNLLMLNYKGQIIDISGASHARICHATTEKWVSVPADLTKAIAHRIFNILVPVVDPVSLITYKEMLTGEHQKIDIEAIRNSMGNR